LKLTDVQYQTGTLIKSFLHMQHENSFFLIAITVTYIPYMAAELPSNLTLKRIGPKIQLPIMMLLWGLVSTCQSQVNSYSGLLACRFFIGLFEGGLFPGLVLYLSGFYRPQELQIRVGLFFCAAALSSAFSGLLATAIQLMEGLRGMHGWQVWNNETGMGTLD
jgi:MFS family permease